MKLHAEQGFRGRVLDLDTGKSVPRVLWLDEQAGELEAYRVDVAGKPVRDANGDFLTYRARGRFRFEPAATEKPHSAPHIVMGAPACARCQSSLTLPGDDLCPPCRAADRGQRNRMRAEPVSGLLLVRPCETKGCGRIAAWCVSDEVSVTPQLHARRLWERGAVVHRRWYCAFHYHPPRLLDSRGETVETFHEAGGVRPQ